MGDHVHRRLIPAGAVVVGVLSVVATAYLWSATTLDWRLVEGENLAALEDAGLPGHFLSLLPPEAQDLRVSYSVYRGRGYADFCLALDSVSGYLEETAARPVSDAEADWGLLMTPTGEELDSSASDYAYYRGGDGLADGVRLLIAVATAASDRNVCVNASGVDHLRSSPSRRGATP